MLGVKDIYLVAESASLSPLRCISNSRLLNPFGILLLFSEDAMVIILHFSQNKYVLVAGATSASAPSRHSLFSFMLFRLFFLIKSERQ